MSGNLSGAHMLEQREQNHIYYDIQTPVVLE